MSKRIFRAIFLVALAVLIACLSLVMGVLYEYFSQLQERQLRTQLDLVAQGVALQGEAYLDGLALADCRVTLVDGGGAVLYDSYAEPSQMENHGGREEIIEAREQGYGESSRYSATLSQKTVYSAKLLPDGTVVRLSTSRYTVLTLLLSMAQPVLLVLAAALILSAVLAGRVSKRLVEPINALNLDDPLSNDAYEEIAPLLTRIERQHRQLSEQMRTLRKQRSEFAAVADNLSEGLILLGAAGDILSLNGAAARLYGADPEQSAGRDILTLDRSLPMQELLEKAAAGRRAETLREIGGRCYQMIASPVKNGEERCGTLLLALDVTERQESEQMRREFTANVSHELRTPLHSISGCAEIMLGGLVKEEDQRRFLEQIYGEAQRLIALVEDIMRLSQLDEGKALPAGEPAELLSLCRKTADHLALQAAEREVSITVSGVPARTAGPEQLVGEVVFNLCDNAVKYNRTGGTVALDVSREGQEAVLTVRDTGIGIPAAEQARVFERFYRVDKSHSRSVGGTGLGLSIVKHAVRALGGSVSLQSEEGKGTIVAVRLPLAPGEAEAAGFDKRAQT